MWPQAFMWAAVSGLADSAKAPALALFVKLRWEEDVEMCVSRPWNDYLCRVDEYAKAVVINYANGNFSLADLFADIYFAALDAR